VYVYVLEAGVCMRGGLGNRTGKRRRVSMCVREYVCV